jgi:hypothetical protein
MINKNQYTENLRLSNMILAVEGKLIIGLPATAMNVLLNLSSQYHKFNFDSKDRVAQS